MINANIRISSDDLEATSIFLQIDYLHSINLQTIACLHFFT